jgi:hypothetical protein
MHATFLVTNLRVPRARTHRTRAEPVERVVRRCVGALGLALLRPQMPTGHKGPTEGTGSSEGGGNPRSAGEVFPRSAPDP